MIQHHTTWLSVKQDIWEQICRQAHQENRSYSNMIGTMIKDYLARVKYEEKSASQIRIKANTSIGHITKAQLGD